MFPRLSSTKGIKFPIVPLFGISVVDFPEVHIDEHVEFVYILEKTTPTTTCTT